MIQEILSLLSRYGIPFSAFSTNGVTVVGEPDSIRKVSEWHHSHTNIEIFWRPEIKRLRAEIEELKGKL